ncbi:MAG: hypothetical protein ACI9QD_000349 [Thermoproteota archaeon]|jgi:hypothetical protein
MKTKNFAIILLLLLSVSSCSTLKKWGTKIGIGKSNTDIIKNTFLKNNVKFQMCYQEHTESLNLSFNLLTIFKLSPEGDASLISVELKKVKNKKRVLRKYKTRFNRVKECIKYVLTTTKFEGLNTDKSLDVAQSFNFFPAKK